jgi:hypothetical protein
MNRPVSGGRGWEIRIGFIGRARGSNALRTNFYLSACWLEGRIIPAAANASPNQTNVMCIYADSVIFIGFFIENCHMWTACGQRVDSVWYLCEVFVLPMIYVYNATVIFV